MKTLLGRSVIALSLLALVGSCVHPFGAVKQDKSTEPLLNGAIEPSTVVDIFARSCQNCHSERTEWPWYSYVPPLSWLIEKDVRNGRSRMNLSAWTSYTPAQQVALLTSLGAAVRNRRMPLSHYLRIHPDAKLSDDEINLVYLWAHSERRRLRRLNDPLQEGPAISTIGPPK